MTNQKMNISEICELVDLLHDLNALKTIIKGL